MKNSQFVLFMLVGAGLLTAFVDINHRTFPARLAYSSNPAPGMDHQGFNRLLKKHVDDRGLVNYRAFKTDSVPLNSYLMQLSRNPPAANWPKNEQIAYWVNAYNAFTIRLILDHYPVKSIKDIGPAVQIKRVNTPWSRKFFAIGGTAMSLDSIEHGILRKNYADFPNWPRIHFTLVCAARSCPRLRNEAYTAQKLAAQLDDQGRDFLNTPAKNNVGPDQAQLSKYFVWYKADWEANGQSVMAWVNRYATGKLRADTRITFLDYDWTLNEQ
jgi:hypothetical protein